MKRIAAIALFVAAILIGAGSASAQEDHVANATIPFNFSVSKSVLPAGNYTIGLDSTMPNVLIINDWEKGVHALAMGVADPNEAGSAAKLVFHKYGDRYFLSDILYSDSSSMVHFPTTNAEKRVRAQSEEAGLRVNNNVTLALK